LPEYSGFTEITEPGPDQLLIIPVTLIFGSEELSSGSMSVAELIPSPFLYMNEREMKKSGLAEKEPAGLNVNGTLIQVEVKVNDSMPDATGGLSVLVPGMPYLTLPSTGKIEKTGR
jgi:NADH-quinone oxidoreductase subunit G